MAHETISAIVSIVTAIIGLAILSVLVSRNAATAQVIGASAGGLAQDISAATAPVSGSGFGSLPNLSLPNSQYNY
jgi:hypothetical protein